MVNARDVQPVELVSATHARLKAYAIQHGLKLRPLATALIEDGLDKREREAAARAEPAKSGLDVNA